ncbi:MAG: hypothetical protein AAGA77_17435 [Bacteroidota bacterium]
MKGSNDLSTAEVNQTHIDSISKSAAENLENAKKYNQDVTQGNQDIYVWADVEFHVHINADQSICHGWIHYQDGRRLYFHGEGLRCIGAPVNMETRQLIPTQILPFEQLNRNTAEFKSKGAGIGSGGELSLRSLKMPVTPLPLQLYGVGFISWMCDGTGKFVAI